MSSFRSSFSNAETPKYKRDKLTFEVVTTVLMKLKVFRDVESCRIVNSYRRFEGTAILLNVGDYLPLNTA
jgi:hypothetical protein